MKRKRVLVTGGAGLIGSNLVRALLAASDRPEVIVADNFSRGRRANLHEGGAWLLPPDSVREVDLRDAAMCTAVAQGVDEIYHLADVVGGIAFALKNQWRILHDNLLIDANMLAAAAQAGVARFLYVGTACSYPQEKQTGADAPPLRETDLLPANPESSYGWSKLMGEYGTLLLGRESTVATGVLRLHNVYGLPTDFSAERAQIIPALVRKAVRYPAEPFVVWGSGAQARSFVHVDDAVRGLLAMMAQGLGPEPIQLGTAHATTIREVAEIVIQVSGKPIAVTYDPAMPEGDRGRCADATRARAVLAWEPRVTLEEGIRRMYQFLAG